MEVIAEELKQESGKLFDFVREKFTEALESEGKPKPTIPESDTKLVFFVKEKTFVKTLLESERRDGKIGYGHKDAPEVPHTRVGGITLLLKHPKNKNKKLIAILLNCPRIRTDAIRYRMGLKEMATIALIHEMIHNFEILTGVFILKSTFPQHDGYTLPIYEAWRAREKP